MRGSQLLSASLTSNAASACVVTGVGREQKLVKVAAEIGPHRALTFACRKNDLDRLPHAELVRRHRNLRLAAPVVRRILLGDRKVPATAPSVRVSEAWDGEIGGRAMLPFAHWLMFTVRPLMFTGPVAVASILVCAWMVTSATAEPI